MEERIKLWLDWEMKDFAEVLQQFTRKTMKKVPLWMALSVIAMVVLGFAVGYDAAYVFRVHFLIGLGIALIIFLAYWVQMKVTSMKKVRPSYEKAIEKLSPEEKEGFIRQMEMKLYEKVDFSNTTTDRYPCRLIVGPDYWLFFRTLNCRIIKVADIERVSKEGENTRVHYNIGNTRVNQRLTVAISLVVDYKAESGREQDRLLLENSKQYDQAIELIRRRCPKSQDFIA